MYDPEPEEPDALAILHNLAADLRAEIAAREDGDGPGTEGYAYLSGLRYALALVEAQIASLAPEPDDEPAHTSAAEDRYNRGGW